MGTSFRTTKAQRETLVKLRSRLGELGYHIFPVAKKFRRHPRDFLAVPKGGTNIGEPDNFLRVHPRRDGAVSIQPFGPLSSFSWQQKQVACIKPTCFLYWLDWMLALPPSGRDGWYKYLPRCYRGTYLPPRQIHSRNLAA